MIFMVLGYKEIIWRTQKTWQYIAFCFAAVLLWASFVDFFIFLYVFVQIYL